MAQNFGNYQVLSKCRLTTDVLRNASASYQRCGYHWGKYDASGGECCKMRDAATTKCWRKGLICKNTAPFPNLCYKPVKEEAVLLREYPKHLKRLLMKGKEHCDLFRYDPCNYTPSNKRRRFQRTWAECPVIWLRPKKTCCFDKEYYPPISRRPKPPSPPPLTAAELFNIRMAQLCTACRLDKKPKLKCNTQPSRKKCERETAPMPSFSECFQNCVQRFCPTECTCSTTPSMCVMWRTFQRHGGVYKKCTEASVDICPFKYRSRTGI